ncbi:MAG TPA: nucleotide exchange factor GrpE [Solirubrobacterales bacterium]|nr:nucleotide exchange factor GrpE [Solirubrobacterales bacterium]
MSESSDRQDLGPEAPGAAGPVTGEDSRALQTDCARESSPAPPAAEATEQDGAQAVEEDFEKLLADANRERDEYLDLARRTKADFENFRKRAAAQAQEALARGKADVAREVIDAVDNLERALEAAGEENGEGLRAGVEMVLGGLRETLQRNGIEQVDPKGEKFDPHRHEALSTQPVEGTESGVVVEVLQKGYTLGDQLIRPARVVVSA